MALGFRVVSPAARPGQAQAGVRWTKGVYAQKPKIFGRENISGLSDYAVTRSLRNLVCRSPRLLRLTPGPSICSCADACDSVVGCNLVLVSFNLALPSHSTVHCKWA